MKNFLIVSRYIRHSGRRPSEVFTYKIDKSGKKFQIGKQSGMAERFSIASVDTTQNIIIVKQRNFGTLKRFKVTEKVNIGLEELTPFNDIPNVKDIVLAKNGFWYAIDPTNTQIFESDGTSQSTSIYKTDLGYTIITRFSKNLLSSIKRGQLVFAIEKIANDRIDIASFMSIYTQAHDLKTIKVAPHAALKIKQAMNGYAYVTTSPIQYNTSPYAPQFSRIHQKINSDLNIISLGLSSLSFKSIDKKLNIFLTKY